MKMEPHRESILKRYAKVIQSESIPQPRFGHTVNLISKNTIGVFGGAISSPGNYTMCADLFIYNITSNYWKKLESSTVGGTPHARAAHASAVVRENQVLFYGGSIGNGQYASDDLWFLDIKNNEDASWMKVPIDGPTPGPRYGHTMVYIIPYLVLFGGSSGGVSSQKNEIMNDVWIFGTAVTPFKWQKINTTGQIPTARSYHNACVYNNYSQNSDVMIIFGGRDGSNNSLKDLTILKNDKGEFEWETIEPATNDILAIPRHQQCSTIFGPFFIVVGGRTGGNQQPTFDVFSFISRRWFRFGTIGLFRHSIWCYFNAQNLDNIDLYLYIYGGFDSENNSQINSNLYRINLLELFSKYEILKSELIDYIREFIKKMNHGHHKKSDGNKNCFELNSKVVVYNIPEENNLGTLIKELSFSKLTEVDKKINEKPANQSSKRKQEYDEDNMKEFLALLPSPDEEFIPLTKNDRPIILSKDFINKLLTDAKAHFVKSPALITLKSPVKIYGNINGAYNDLIRYFSLFGRPSEFKGDIECMDYLFLGNIVNRGAFSLETFLLLIALKLKYTTSFHILRGSHEDMEISKCFGLGQECELKLGENINDKNSIFRKICDLFEYFPLAAVINNQILCVHSGIGEHFKSLTDLTSLKKPINLSNSLIAQEILWNTPLSSPENYIANNPTTKYRDKHFDEAMVHEFLKKNNLKLIIRSHDVSSSGIEKCYNNKVITIFSATNYCNVYQNSGCILFIKKSYEIQPKMLICEDNYPVWINNWAKTDCPPSPKREYKK